MSKSESEMEEILEELQKVLREHVTLARNALEGQLTSLRAMEEIANAQPAARERQRRSAFRFTHG
jgi:hypothetical protein